MLNVLRIKIQWIRITVVLVFALQVYACSEDSVSPTPSPEPLQSCDWFWQKPSPTGEWLFGVTYTDANTGTAVGRSGTILRTTDGGTTWVSQTSGTSNNLFGVSFTDANTGTAVGFNGTILRTTDGGATWASQTAGPPGRVKRAARATFSQAYHSRAPIQGPAWDLTAPSFGQPTAGPPGRVKPAARPTTS
jgi:photosystem II stability/assembly factor-like uncharacterized protein